MVLSAFEFLHLPMLNSTSDWVSIDFFSSCDPRTTEASGQEQQKRANWHLRYRWVYCRTNNLFPLNKVSTVTATTQKNTVQRQTLVSFKLIL